jgi:hypothetical protein
VLTRLDGIQISLVGLINKFNRRVRTDAITARRLDRFKEVAVFQIAGVNKIYI